MRRESIARHRWRCLGRSIASVGLALPFALGTLDASAQQDADDAPQPASDAAAPAPSSPPSPSDEAPAVVPPRALGSLDVEYPEGAEGDAAVVLELLIDQRGVITDSKVISGDDPFASRARAASLSWTFEPARRAGQPMAARIRMQVLFAPPPPEPSETTPPSSATSAENAPPPAKDAQASSSLPTTPNSTGPAAASGAEATSDEVEITVVGERPADVKRLGRAEVRQMPGAFGDPYRAIESLPGVTPIVSGLPYFFVRGAPPGNVGYFFDEMSVPLLYHVAVGPGVIHPAFISSVDLYSGAYPARFGRYAGGIVSGEAEEPQWRSRGEANLRLIDAGAFVEVPFAEGRGSAMVAGRYSYTGLVVSLLAPDASLGYWDYQAKFTYDLSNEDTLSVFSFGSHDYFAADNAQGEEVEVLDLTFHRLNLAYRRQLDNRSSLRFASTLGLDRTGVGGDPDGDEEDPGSLLTRSVGARLAYDRQVTDDVRFRSGADALFSRVGIQINPGDGFGDEEDDSSGFVNVREATYPTPGFPGLIVLDPLFDANQARTEAEIDSRFVSRDDLVGGAWLETVVDVGSGVTLTPGFRLDLYKTGSTVSVAPEPRLSARYDLSPKVSLTHSVGIAHQPPSFAIPIPGLSTSANEGLQRAVQSSAGVETKLPWRLTASATVFQNITFDSTDIFSVSRLSSTDPSTNAFIARTTNHSYGLELYLKRSLTERLGGFVSYTLSRSHRTVDRLEGPSSFDRRHVLNVALAYDLGRRWRLGGRAVTYSGAPSEVGYSEAAATPPRAPWFSRLDVRLEKRWLIANSGAWWSLVIEMLNATLAKETTESSCYAYGCLEEAIGPVSIPSIGIEAAF